MRKIIVLLVASALLLTGCSSLFNRNRPVPQTPIASNSALPTPSASIVVPDAVGLTDADAQDVIRGADLVVKWDSGKEVFHSGNWVVVSQVPAAGASAAPASIVTLTVERPTAQTPTKAPPVKTGSDVQYKVTGDGGAATTITYTNLTDGKYSQDQIKGAKLPWSSGFDFTRRDLFTPSALTLAALGSASTTKITCEILVKGKTVSTKTATGPYAFAICAGG